MKINQKTMTLYCTEKEYKVIGKFWNAGFIHVNQGSDKQLIRLPLLTEMSMDDFRAALEFLLIERQNAFVYPGMRFLKIDIVPEDELYRIDNIVYDKPCKEKKTPEDFGLKARVEFIGDNHEKRS